MKPKDPISAQLALLCAFIALVACGDNLIVDPSFDLWCGNKLCKPWESTGKISRVGTWHEHDYGIALGDGATLSQLTTHDRVDCIAFEVIADVSASADVWLEMDFRDDGRSEYKQLVPESHFAKLRYLVKTPTWYDRLRFVLRKNGIGRAVLAQIKATSSDECEGEPLPLLDRPHGAGCESADQCSDAVCAHAPAEFMPGLAPVTEDGTPMSCSECTRDADCNNDQVCGAIQGDSGSYRRCVSRFSLKAGSWCLTDAECAGDARCLVPGVLTHGACAACNSDDECNDGEVCGVGQINRSVARTCVPVAHRALGGICAEDAECLSGVCNKGACSECNDENPCQGGEACGSIEAEWLTVEASLCNPGSGTRDLGDDCTHDRDCRSGHCDEPDAFCQLCLGDVCESTNAPDCGFLRKLTGTCR